MNSHLKYLVIFDIFKFLVLLFLLDMNIYAQTLSNKQVNINNRKYYTKNVQSTDTLLNTNNINLNINNNSGGSEGFDGTGLFNLISIIIGVVGLLIAIGGSGSNFFSLKNLKQEFTLEKEELKKIHEAAILKFNELDQKYNVIIQKYSSLSNEIMEWYENIKIDVTDKISYGFYVRGIINKIDDSQPVPVILSALRIVANMSIIDAVPNIDQLLISEKIDAETKNFANGIKMNLLKIK